MIGNSMGDWVGCIEDQLGVNGNTSLDPMFCDTANGDFTIKDISPCAPENNSCGTLIGALGIGCTNEIPEITSPSEISVFEDSLLAGRPRLAVGMIVCYIKSCHV